MKLIATSIFVDDQDKALHFYTEKLGFVVKNDIPVGEFRWLTVISPQQSSEFELLLEPNAHPAAMEYQRRIYEDGIPANMLGVDDLQAAYADLTAKDVQFVMEPTDMGGYKMATIDDTCGNIIQLIEQ